MTSIRLRIEGRVQGVGYWAERFRKSVSPRRRGSDFPIRSATKTKQHSRSAERLWFADQARSLELTGWVRNRHDGSVEALVQGPAASLDVLRRRCGEGPPASHVTRVTELADDAAVYEGFRILLTE